MITRITVNCACGSYIGAHWCDMSWEAPEVEPQFTLGEVRMALSEAMGGDIPMWVWDDVRGRLKGLRRMIGETK